jgi:hypothetical protein
MECEMKSLNKCKRVIRKAANLHWSAHAGYFGFVFFEAHGHYRYFAGVLLVLMVIDLIFHDDDDKGEIA